MIIIILIIQIMQITLIMHILSHTLGVSVSKASIQDVRNEWKSGHFAFDIDFVCSDSKSRSDIFRKTTLNMMFYSRLLGRGENRACVIFNDFQ
jgi:hypothetical protein